MSDNSVGKDTAMGKMGETGRQARDLRGLYVGKLMNKEITFRDFVTLAQIPENKTLNKMRVIDILAKMGGWSNHSAMGAFTSLDIDSKTTVRQCYGNKYLLATCSDLFDRQSTMWQKRLKAPDNWPWSGNVIAYIIAQCDNDEIPRSVATIAKNSRFEIPGDQEINDDVLSTVEDYVNDDTSKDFEKLPKRNFTKRVKKDDASPDNTPQTMTEKSTVMSIDETMNEILNEARVERKQELDEMEPSPWSNPNRENSAGDESNETTPRDDTSIRAAAQDDDVDGEELMDLVHLLNDDSEPKPAGTNGEEDDVSYDAGGGDVELAHLLGDDDDDLSDLF